jgi:hypothetical protein
MIYLKEGVPVTDLHWAAPTSRTDGSAYGTSDHKGYELGVEDINGNISPWVGVPAAYEITSWPLSQLNMDEEGIHAVALRTVDSGDRVSEWSASVTFVAEVAPPKSPTGMAIS